MGDPAFWASVVPWTIPAGILGIWALCWWGFLYPRLLVWLLAATLIAGQLIRLPLPGQGGGLLPSDIIAFILLCVLALHLVGQKIKPELILFGSLLAAFLIYALGRAFGGIGSLPAAQHFLVVFAYWVRLATYLLLIPCLMQAASRNQALAVTIRKSFLTAVTCLALMGIMQFFLIPNLAALQLSGWDPHEQRLVSTWLDPNLLGLLFVITIPFVTTQYIKTKQNKIGKAGMLKPGFGSRALTSLTYAVILALLLLALLGTASRSSFIAAAVSFLGICWGVTFMYRRSLSQAAAGILVAAQMLIGLGSILVVVLFPTRFAGLLTADATVSLRQEALTQAVARLVEPHAITGVGYNAYQFVAREQSLVSNFSIHSRAGADNSLLTLWVTSGAIGLMLAGLAFTGAWVCMTHGQGPLVVWTAIGVLVAIFIHSQFVNSALYGHILLGVALLASSLYASKNFPPRYAH